MESPRAPLRSVRGTARRARFPSVDYLDKLITTETGVRTAGNERQRMGHGRDLNRQKLLGEFRRCGGDIPT